MPAVVAWASGRVTSSALTNMLMVLTGMAPADPLPTMMALLRPTAVGKEIIYRLSRRAIVKGAGSCWWRLHVPATNYPYKVFQIVDPSLTLARKLQIVRDIFDSHPCCLGVFVADVQAWLKRAYGLELPGIFGVGDDVLPTRVDIVLELEDDDDDDVDVIGDDVFNSLSAGLTCVARVTPLATHIIEREHGVEHKQVQAAKSQGHATGAQQISAGHVIRRTRPIAPPLLFVCRMSNAQLCWSRLCP